MARIGFAASRISACGTSVAATVILPLLATDAPCAESEDASVADDASDAVSDAEAPALLPDADELRRWQDLPAAEQAKQAPDQLILPAMGLILACLLMARRRDIGWMEGRAHE